MSANVSKKNNKLQTLAIKSKKNNAFLYATWCFLTTMRHIATHEEGKRKIRSTPGKGTGVVMIKLCPRTSCLRTYYYAAKVQSFVFIHNVSLFETAKMYCEAAIYSFEAIIGIPLFVERS